MQYFPKFHHSRAHSASERKRSTHFHDQTMATDDAGQWTTVTSGAVVGAAAPLFHKGVFAIGWHAHPSATGRNRYYAVAIFMSAIDPGTSFYGI
jgi:hypothetical protein